jgi:hypothetical protein
LRARIWTLLVLAGLHGCSDPVPEITSLRWSPNPNPRAPLALTGELTTDRPARARILLDDGERTTTIDRGLVLREAPEAAMADAQEPARTSDASMETVCT